MPRATSILSWKGIAQEIGQKPSPPEWEEKYHIPTGTPFKVAVILRLYHAIIEEKAYYLIPKLMEYTEPSTKQVEVNVTDWRTRFEQANIPLGLVAERLRTALTQAMNQEARAILDERADATIDAPANRIIQPSRSAEPDSPGRSNSADGDAEPTGGQETGSAALDSYAETETAE